MIWFPHFPPKREGTATAPEGKVETNNVKASYLLRQLQRDVCTRIHQKSHLLCTAPKEKGRVAHTNPHHADWNSDPKTVKGEKQWVQQANLKKISSLLLSSVHTGFTENTQAGNEKQIFTMKKDSMSALPSSCPHAETNSNSPSDQSQQSNLSPLGTIPTTVSSGHSQSFASWAAQLASVQL